jgi:hypothetical protein
MATEDPVGVIASAIRSLVRQPLGAPRILMDSDEQIALAVIEALEEAGFEIVKRAD